MLENLEVGMALSDGRPLSTKGRAKNVIRVRSLSVNVLANQEGSYFAAVSSPTLSEGARVPQSGNKVYRSSSKNL